MPLAETRIRGAALNCRLAVNGIQYGSCVLAFGRCVPSGMFGPLLLHGKAINGRRRRQGNNDSLSANR